MTINELVEMLIECKQNKIVLSFHTNISEESNSIVPSKWGGFPDLPDNFDWPRNQDPLPLPRPKNEFRQEADKDIKSSLSDLTNVEEEKAKTANNSINNAYSKTNEDSSKSSTYINHNANLGQPLSFLMQINLADIKKFDLDESLPTQGVLAFFYDLEEQPWGYEYSHKAAHRIYYFPNENELNPTSPPLDLMDAFILPEAFISANSEPSILSWDDFSVPLNIEDRIASDEADQFTIFHNISQFKGKITKDGLQSSIDLKKMFYEAYDVLSREFTLSNSIHQLLGHACPIRGNITEECELVSRGFSYGDEIENIPAIEIELAAANSLADWQLLLQIDLSSLEDICPHALDDHITRLFFYVLKDDLRDMNFDHSIAVIQGA